MKQEDSQSVIRSFETKKWRSKSTTWGLKLIKMSNLRKERGRMFNSLYNQQWNNLYVQRSQSTGLHYIQLSLHEEEPAIEKHSVNQRKQQPNHNTYIWRIQQLERHLLCKIIERRYFGLWSTNSNMTLVYAQWLWGFYCCMFPLVCVFRWRFPVNCISLLPLCIWT